MKGKGFVYIDILLASILAMGLFSLAIEFISYERAVLSNGKRTVAVYLAQAELEKMKNGFSDGAIAKTEINNTEFTLKPAKRAYAEQLLQLEVKVSWYEGTVEKNYSLLMLQRR